MDKESAILQGGFFLANKLSLPSSLSSLEKGDWDRVGQPVLEAVQELCGQVEHNRNTDAVHWQKKIICVLWCKILCQEYGEDVETGWRENPFFPTQNCLPEVNRVVLLELVKSMAAAQIFGQLLCCLPHADICTELGRLAQHVTYGPTSENDVSLFLEVWWELWRGRSVGKTEGEDSVEKLFTNHFSRLSSQPRPSLTNSVSPQAKRFKLDTSSSGTTDVLGLLLHALGELRDRVSTTDLCHRALSVSLNAVYTSFLIDQGVPLSTEQKLQFISKVVRLRTTQDGKVTSELIQEAQRDLCASHSPSQFRPSEMSLTQALRIITELAQLWQGRGLLKLTDSTKPTYTAFTLDQGIRRTLRAMEVADVPETMSEVEDKPTTSGMKHLLGEMLESMAFPALEERPEVNARVTMTIINDRLDDYQDFGVLYAAEKRWVMEDGQWIDCLDKNQTVFRQHGTVVTLASTLMSVCQSDATDLNQCRKLMRVISSIFTELPLEDKSKALAAMLRKSSKGLFGASLPSGMTEGFAQELNMAFNCIIQGGGGASSPGLHGNLSTATSLVARVSFQNPEAALRCCCNSAIFNKGAFSLMAKILQQLPGLRGGVRENMMQRSEEGPSGSEEEEQADGRSAFTCDKSLLCRCLEETIRNKSLSANEKEQFLKFLGLLMRPVIEVEGEERMQSFLSPQEVVRAFVLPYLNTPDGPINMEVGLQLLNSALGVAPQGPASPHWIMGCSPFPLLHILAQHLNQAPRCWEQPLEGGAPHLSLDTKELLVSVLTTLGQVVGREVAAAPSTWSRALFWLYNKVEELDWTVRFHLKPVWGEHFKNEVPRSLLAVCDLPEQEWSGLKLPHYGEGTGLLAWMECCSMSDSLQLTMLSCLSLDERRPDHVNLFSKGLLVALTQTLPWCSVSEWSRLLRSLRELLGSGRLHAPYSLEYVDYLPLLNLRGFSCELRLSVLLLRVLQLLCGASCSHWLPTEGWVHVGRLYAHAVRETLDVLRAKLPLSTSRSSATAPASAPASPKTSEGGKADSSLVSSTLPVVDEGSRVSVTATLGTSQKTSSDAPSEELQKEGGVGTAPSQEVLFVLSQLFCHVQHAHVMMPGGQCEALFLCALEILSLYEAIMAAFPESSTHLESDNTRHFFSTITDNLENKEMRAVLQQKIGQLMSSMA